MRSHLQHRSEGRGAPCSRTSTALGAGPGKLALEAAVVQGRDGFEANGCLLRSWLMRCTRI